jgi:hypothetical protein
MRSFLPRDNGSGATIARVGRAARGVDRLEEREGKVLLRIAEDELR